MHWRYVLETVTCMLVSAGLHASAAPNGMTGYVASPRQARDGPSTMVEGPQTSSVPLPGDFAASSRPNNPKNHFSLAYSHGNIQINPDVNLTAVSFGAAYLRPALQAAISEAKDRSIGGGGGGGPMDYLNISSNRLSLIVKSVATNTTQFKMSWNDYAVVLQVLLNDTQKQTNYSSLFVGAVTDDNKNVHAEVAIIPELIIISQPEVSTAENPVNLLNSTTPAKSIPVRPPARRLPEDNSQRQRQRQREQFLPLSRQGPPIEGTDLSMRLLERRQRVRRTRLRTAWNSVRDSLLSLPPGSISNEASGFFIVSPEIPLRRVSPEIPLRRAAYLTFHLRILDVRDSEPSPSIARDLPALLAAIQTVMDQLDHVAHLPSGEITRQETIVATFDFRISFAPNGESMRGNSGREDLGGQISSSGAMRSEVSSPSIDLQPAPSSEASITKSSQIATKIDSGQMEKVMRSCAFWAVCFLGSSTEL